MAVCWPRSRTRWRCSRPCLPARRWRAVAAARRSPANRPRLARDCCSTTEQADLLRLDLQRHVLRIDAALRQAAGDEPQAGLRRAHEHVAQFLLAAEAPDRADA